MQNIFIVLCTLLGMQSLAHATEINLMPISISGPVASFPNSLEAAQHHVFIPRTFAVLVNGQPLLLPLPDSKDGPKAVRFVVCNERCSPLPSTLGEMKVANVILANVQGNALITLENNQACTIGPGGLNQAFYACIGPALQRQVFSRMH